MYFLLSFILCLPLVHIIDYTIHYFINNSLVSFFIVHLIFVDLCNDRYDLLWFLITILHGIAHIIHPAYHGTIFNTNYTPLYDYIVHAVQCLCIYAYNPSYTIAGIFFFITTMIAGIKAHFDSTFLETGIWVLLSGGAALFGSQAHMMLLNRTKNNEIFYSSLLLWITPYVMYLVPFNYIPMVDHFLNTIGLFRLWYLNFFVALYVYRQMTPL